MGARFDAHLMGYRMPAEWEPMGVMWLGWPILQNREELWGEHYEAVEREFALVAQTIAKYMPCHVAANFSRAERAQALCGTNVSVHAMAVEDNWVRDCGPIFLQSTQGKGLAAAVFRFNAWGEKYQPYDGCQQAAQDIARKASATIFNSHMVLEGGSFYVDGKGTLLTTESCLLNPNRNPHMSRYEIEVELKRMLGVSKIIWLPGNPLEVETNGHVDGIASFIGVGKVLCQTAHPDQPEFVRVMQENRRALELATDASGQSFEFLELPGALVKDDYGSPRYCDSYANYILINNALIGTAYGVTQDEEARRIFQVAYPDRSIELLPITHISIGGGSVHCSTQQQPAV